MKLRDEMLGVVKFRLPLSLPLPEEVKLAEPLKTVSADFCAFNSGAAMLASKVPTPVRSPT